MSAAWHVLNNSLISKINHINEFDLNKSLAILKIICYSFSHRGRK